MPLVLLSTYVANFIRASCLITFSLTHVQATFLVLNEVMELWYLFPKHLCSADLCADK